MAVEAAVGAMTIAVIHGSPANRAGSVSRTRCFASGFQVPVGDKKETLRGIGMPTGRSTFTKRQKEHTRQQRQRDKAERRNQRKQEKAVVGSVDEMAELREHAAEQAALFNLGAEESEN